MAELKREKLKIEAEQKAEELKAVKLEFKLNVGENGKVFGAVTGKDIIAALVSAGHKVDRKQIRLTESIRGVGKYLVEVKLHSAVFAQLEVEVFAQKSEKAQKATGKKKGRGKKAEESMEAEGLEASEEEISTEEISENNEALVDEVSKEGDSEQE